MDRNSVNVWLRESQLSSSWMVGTLAGWQGSTQGQQCPGSNISDNGRCPASLTRVTSKLKVTQVAVELRSADTGGSTGVTPLVAVGAGPSFPCPCQAAANSCAHAQDFSHITGRVYLLEKAAFPASHINGHRSIKIDDTDVKMTWLVVSGYIKGSTLVIIIALV